MARAPQGPVFTTFISPLAASRLAVGTIRLVPPPHPRHPQQHDAEDPDAHSHSSLNSRPDRTEPYIKLTRLAVLAPYRRLGLARSLLSAALAFASSHATEFIPGPSPASSRETERSTTPVALGEDGSNAPERPWQGLIRVHAQEKVIDWWERQGFALDRAAVPGKESEHGGEGAVAQGWDEEGIWHLGMWKRVTL